MKQPGDSLFQLIHKYFLFILLSSYLVATFWPHPGEAIRSVSFGKLVWPEGNSIQLTLPLLMLSFLLFNAGVGIKTSEILNIGKHPLPLFLGLLSNLAIPLSFTFLLSLFNDCCHSPLDFQNVIVGLALIASMPIAGSSTAWAQNSNGNLALSIGLVICSTILSPVLTPVTLDLVSMVTKGDYARDLHHLAHQGSMTFLVISVVLPSLLGMLTHYVLSQKVLERIKPSLKLLNLINLLLLNYSNAAISLPQIFQKPDLKFLLVILGITLALCLTSFSVGWLIARVLRLPKADQASLMFGLGMNNNGTGLVLASTALSSHPLVMLPIIFYNLIQQTVAGIVDWLLFANKDEEPNNTNDEIFKGKINKLLLISANKGR